MRQIFTVIIEGEDDLGEIDIQDAIETMINEKKYKAIVKDVIRRE